MKINNFWNNECGQATVELAIMFPIVIIIAVIAVNALTFFSSCANFDRAFKQEVVSYATNPGYGEDIANTRSILQNNLTEKFDNSFMDFNISVENVSGGLQAFYGELKMHPTLFGMGLRDEILGLPMPTLNHQQKIVIERYKPGVIF